MKDLRKLAKGQPCQVRLFGVCNHNDETTVLAHVRIAGISGMGMKSPDLIAAWACSNCHDAVDRRGYMKLNLDAVRLAHLEGMARTINELYKLEVL